MLNLVNSCNYVVITLCRIWGGITGWALETGGLHNSAQDHLCQHFVRAGVEKFINTGNNVEVMLGFRFVRIIDKLPLPQVVLYMSEFQIKDSTD